MGIIIPPDFPKKLANRKAEIQVFIDGVDANTAGIARSYITQIIQQYNLSLADNQANIPVSTQVVFLYNPGLTSSWFFVPGVMGVVLTLISTLISAVIVVRGKRYGNFRTIAHDSSDELGNFTLENFTISVLANGRCFAGFDFRKIGI
ncbi:ABC transporter permease [Nostoc sp.]